jgi:hypothetical protein
MTGVTAMVAAGAINRLFSVRVTVSQTYSANTTQTTSNVSALSGYVAGSTDIIITVNSGIYVYSTSTATPALTISGATAGDRVYLVNNGFIMGKGGDAGSNGGPALSLATPTFITNNSYIAGGGGGGASITTGSQPAGGGGGAGGGAGGSTSTAAGGAGGAIGQSGSNGARVAGFGANYNGIGGGGGGGRILPGNGGRGAFGAYFEGLASTLDICIINYAGLGGEAGGGGGKFSGFGISPFFQTAVQSVTGGGGGWGAAGGLALTGTYAITDVVNSGAGGSASAAGFNAFNQATNGTTGTQGSGGKAINLNGYSVTYITQGSIFGAVS